MSTQHAAAVQKANSILGIIRNSSGAVLEVGMGEEGTIPTAQAEIIALLSHSS